MFFLYFLCCESISYHCWHLFPFLRKTTKPLQYFFQQSYAVSSSLPAAREQSGRKWQIHLCLNTPFLSIIKRKKSWKHIQRDESLQPLWSEESCWEIPYEAWCCLHLSYAWYTDSQIGRETPSAILSYFWGCCHKISTKLVPVVCKDDKGWTILWPLGPLLMQRWKQHSHFSSFSLTESVPAEMSFVASAVNPHARCSAPLL